MPRYRVPTPILAMAVAAVLTAGAPAWPQATTQPAAARPGSDAGALDLETYVQAIATADMFAIESAGLVAARSQEPTVRAFATTLITDYTRLQARLHEVLAEGGHDALLPSRLDAPHMQMLERLEQTGGADFDRLFAQAQVAALQEARRMHEAYYTTGNDHDLVAFAGAALKVVRRHEEMLKKGISPLDSATGQAL
ncbi:MAG: DUF4142 domain-containing protein [Ferrovibrionaceae bacterium]